MMQPVDFQISHLPNGNKIVTQTFLGRPKYNFEATPEDLAILFQRVRSTLWFLGNDDEDINALIDKATKSSSYSGWKYGPDGERMNA